MADLERGVLVTGASGLVGGRLVADLLADRIPVRALSRRARTQDPQTSGPEWLEWDGTHPPAAALRGLDAVVHLAGEPIFGGLPTASRRARMRASRIDSTHALVTELGRLEPDDRPSVLVCASAVGYYGDRGEEQLTETSPPGDGFLAELCVDWEAAALEARGHGLRVVTPRIGVVLAREGGALALMAVPFRLGLGGRLGSGRQWFPWIQVDDLVALLRFALDRPDLEGPVNAVAPGVVRNAELTRELASVLGRPAVVPVPALALRVALGDLAGELLGSKRVAPAAALAGGFTFAHATLRTALEAELS